MIALDPEDKAIALLEGQRLTYRAGHGDLTLRAEAGGDFHHCLLTFLWL
jgi:hypothetical protein